MNRVFLIRLSLDLVAVGLLVAGLAYWWLDNTAHELIGSGMFLLIIVHNVFNRRWYGMVPKGRYDARRRINLSVIAVLGVTMLVLLVTSVMISRDLFGFLGLDLNMTAREIHLLAAYWVLLVVAIHLGTRWSVVMNALRLTTGNTVGVWAMRLVTAGIAAYGIHSSMVMTFGSKLLLIPALDMWDFNESVLGFFLHYGSIIALYAAITHYVLRWFQDRKRRIA